MEGLVLACCHDNMKQDQKEAKGDQGRQETKRGMRPREARGLRGPRVLQGLNMPQSHVPSLIRPYSILFFVRSLHCPLQGLPSRLLPLLSYELG